MVMEEKIRIPNLDKAKYGPQRTLVRRAEVAGFGFWTGKDVLLEFLPAPENYGIRFSRTGSDSEPVPALLENRAEKPHQSSLTDGAVRFDMVEHVLAALAGEQIDNCLVRINGEEMPGIDGSSRPFSEAIRAVGIKEQNAPRRLRVLMSPVRLEGEWGWIEALPSEAGEISYRYELDYSRHESAPTTLQKQSFEVTFYSDAEKSADHFFETEVAPARTFLTSAEAYRLLEMGLCKRVTPRDALVFGPEGPIDNTLRYPDECARHKVLDMMGDFSLGGALLVAKVRAHCTGHVQNAALLKMILEQTSII